MTVTAKRYLRRLGLPGDRDAYERTIRARFLKEMRLGMSAGQPAVPVPEPALASEEAIEYVGRIMDRQINKAIGLLAFDALLFAASALVDVRLPFGKTGWASKIPVAGAAVSLIGCLPIFYILLLKWGDPEQLQNADTELNGMLRAIWTRTYCLSFAIYAAAIATLLALASMGAILLESL